MKRICENCAYFEDSGISKSGWCRHPERAIANSVQLMVRKGELACRNGWGVDSWVPVGSAGADPTVNGQREGNVDSPDAPALLLGDDLVVSQHFGLSQENSRPVVEDILVGQSPVTGDRTPGQRLDQSDQPWSPQSAVRRAHEQAKANHLRAGKAIRAAEQILASNGEPLLVHADTGLSNNAPPIWPRPRSESKSVPVQESVPIVAVGPVTREEIQRSDELPTYFPEDSARFESVPELEPGDPFALHDAVELSNLPGIDFEAEEADLGPYPADDEMTPPRETRRRLGFLKRQRPDLENAALPELNEAWFTPSHANGAHIRRQPLAASNTGQNGDGKLQAGYATDDMAPLPHPAGPDPLSYFTPPIPSVRSDVQWGVFRNCSTCRNFKPEGDGSRGWCTNKWAFPHSRMVDGAHLSCHSSKGDWWTSHDEVWLSTVDVSHHTDFTPAYDRYIAHKERIALESSGAPASTANLRRGA